MNQSGFRQDINGLRALAVLAVVAFHFNSTRLPGGFAGVDVFFVISGFLMTSIIFRGIESNTLSLIKFYTSRAKRILPALITVVLTLLFLGLFFLEPLSYQLLGKHSFDSIFFISNFTYLNESGYFDSDANSKYLLHTWSLSAEWQFYIIYPFVLFVFSKKISIKKLKIIIVLFSVILFILSLFLSKFNPTSSYFMLHSRAWEMMVGGVAYLYPLKVSEKIKKFIEVIGVSLIMVSFFIIDDKFIWPGYAALLPVLSTYLVIAVNNERTILSNRVLQIVGACSYSIYLVHWPVIVIINQFGIGVPFVFYITFVFISSFVLYKVIEKKRDYGISLLFAFVAVVLFSLLVRVDGVSSRVQGDKYQLTINELARKYYGGFYFWDETFAKKHSFNESKGKAQFVLVGDSYAMMYLKAFSDSGKPFISIVQTVCMIIPDYLTNYANEIVEKCDETKNLAINEISADQSTPVVISQNWNAYFDQRLVGDDTEKVTVETYPHIIKTQIEKIMKIGGESRNYYIVGTYTHPNYDVYSCLARASLNSLLKNNLCEQKLAKVESPIDSIFIELEGKYNNLFFIDPKKAQCDENNECYLIYNGDVFFYDGDHLSIYGADLIGDYILEFIDKIEK